ncbi:unnamed protein product [Clonostachys solani]|uniref:Glycosyl transferase family 1 domain-containing protein n=1 Tax=Clonostachys solani TaxID=160281 RepID=A0A9N9ZE14_9HYPO|nr:unnamed protein product [Clonostachys solani]
MDSTYCSLHMRRKALVAQTERSCHLDLTKLWCGISATVKDDSTLVVGLAIRDILYLRDFYEVKVVIDSGSGRDAVANHLIEFLRLYERENLAKFIGCGIPSTLIDHIGNLCSRLWLELDIVPIVMPTKSLHHARGCWMAKAVDEQADSMARKCIVYFGPSAVPRLQVGWHGVVQVSISGMARLARLQDYEAISSRGTWEAMAFYADKMRQKGTKVAFFSATPHAGGVATARHALVRFSNLLNLAITWHVPKPRKDVFRIAKTIQNILRGVSKPYRYILPADRAAMLDWTAENAERYWLVEGGPLRPPAEGGADIVVIDDPQIMGLIPIAKAAAKDRPVLYRSHIQLRADLIEKLGTPHNEGWNFVWDYPPYPGVYPPVVPREKVAYLPTTSDWLDALNKNISPWDTGFYMHSYNAQCYKYGMTELEWPARKYIIEIVPFDYAEGASTVISAYATFRDVISETTSVSPPQLVICGNGSVDDPDRKFIYKEIMTDIDTKYQYLKQDISVMPVEGSDQLFNVLIRNANVVLQLSSSEGSDVKVAEALHAGRPVIASRSSGTSLLIKDGANGFLVEPGDQDAAAGCLVGLFTDNKLYEKISAAAKTGLSEEVSNVGDALAWYYLASKFAADPGFKCNERWVNDMAREEAGKPYAPEENRLPR